MIVPVNTVTSGSGSGSDCDSASSGSAWAVIEPVLLVGMGVIDPLVVMRVVMIILQSLFALFYSIATTPTIILKLSLPLTLTPLALSLPPPLPLLALSPSPPLLSL